MGPVFKAGYFHNLEIVLSYINVYVELKDRAIELHFA